MGIDPVADRLLSVSEGVVDAALRRAVPFMRTCLGVALDIAPFLPVVPVPFMRTGYLISIGTWVLLGLRIRPVSVTSIFASG